MAWLEILFGLVVLFAGAEALVRGSSWIAESLGIRPITVGLTVVAIGTSAPELVVSIIAANKGETGLVIGNIFGSNTANLALILGLTAALRSISTPAAKTRFEIAWLIIASLMVFVSFLGNEYSQLLGLTMIAMLALFLTWLVRREQRERPNTVERSKSWRPRGQGAAAETLQHVALTCIGGVCLYFGGGWLVTGAVTIAEELGMSPPVIGATVIAIGTSLPELAASIVAARRGQPEMAVGNVIGSNIFNILLVLGVTSTISPIPVSWADHGVRTLVPMILTGFIAFLLLRNRRISKPAGIVLLASYVWYIIWEVLQT